MAITQGLCVSFKLALLNGEMDFSADTSQVFKIALYSSAADLSPSTAAYSSDEEVTGSGYTAGGATLTPTTPTTSGTTAYLDFADVVWANATITARGALIYKADGAANPAVAVLDFGADKVSSGGDFAIQFPAADALNAILRLA